MKAKFDKRISYVNRMREAGTIASRPIAIAAALSLAALAGCVVVPLGTDSSGKPAYAIGIPAAVSTAPSPLVSSAAQSVALPVRLYPANDVATQSGVLTGTVTNMMSGKGRFQFDYRGELLSGEATRVAGEERRGVANAYGPRGTYCSCDYQMSSPVQGAGNCTFSDGAKYQVHIGG